MWRPRADHGQKRAPGEPTTQKKGLTRGPLQKGGQPLLAVAHQAGVRSCVINSCFLMPGLRLLMGNAGGQPQEAVAPPTAEENVPMSRWFGLSAMISALSLIAL